MAFRYYFSVLGLLLLVAVPHRGMAENRVLPPWKELPESQRQLWRSAVAPIFAEATRAGELGPEGNYRFLNLLSRITPARDKATSPALPWSRFLELEVAYNLLSERLRSAIDEPSTDTLRKWTETMPHAFVPDDRVDLQSIYIRKFSDETTESARRRAQNALQMLEEGTSFPTVALLMSDARSSALHGSAGTIARGTVAPEIDEVIFSLAEGETTGPLERENGFHIFRINAIRPGFSLERREDAAKARNLWYEWQVLTAIQGTVDRWNKIHKASVRSEPSDSSAPWLQEPWIEHSAGTSEPFALVYLEVVRRDLNTTDSAFWNDFWAEEAGAYAPKAIGNLAALPTVQQSPKFASALDMALRIQPGLDYLRDWLAQQQSTEQQLQAFFDARAAELFPPIPRYSFLHWHVPVPRHDGTEVREHLAHLHAMLNEVYGTIKDESPTTEPAARALFDRLNAAFPGSNWEKMEHVDSVSPFLDPALVRTEIGTLSRPFDSSTGVGLVFMIERDVEHATLDKVRDTVTHYWRTERLRRFMEEILDQEEERFTSSSGIR